MIECERGSNYRSRSASGTESGPVHLLYPIKASLVFHWEAVPPAYGSKGPSVQLYSPTELGHIDISAYSKNVMDNDQPVLQKMLTYSRSKDQVCYDVCVLHLSGHGLPSRNTRARAVADDDRELALALALPCRMDFPLTCQRTRLCTLPLTF